MQLHNYSKTMPSDVPPIFSPRVLRKTIVYNDLSQRSLSVSEKTFLGTEAASLSSFLEWSPNKVSRLTQLSNRYRLPYSTVKNWSEKIKLNKAISIELGRPQSLDKTDFSGEKRKIVFHYMRLCLYSLKESLPPRKCDRENHAEEVVQAIQFDCT